jgi:hypothetical protein
VAHIIADHRANTGEFAAARHAQTFEKVTGTRERASAREGAI